MPCDWWFCSRKGVRDDYDLNKRLNCRLVSQSLWPPRFDAVYILVSQERLRDDRLLTFRNYLVVCGGSEKAIRNKRYQIHDTAGCVIIYEQIVSPGHDVDGKMNADSIISNHLNICVERTQCYIHV